MDYEFQHESDNEEETFITEKTKKRDGSAKKKSKSSQLFRSSEKRDKGIYNDSPAIVKQKHTVHGLVGPADYEHQASPPLTTDKPTLPIEQTETAISSSTEAINAQWTPQPQQPQQQPQQQVFVQQPSLAAQSPVQAPAQPFPQHIPQVQSVTPQNPPTNQLPMPFPQQVPIIPKPNNNTQSPAGFPPSFSPVPTTISTKIERPHSSAALQIDRQNTQAPTPFKQPTPQKMTLLAQAMTSNQFPGVQGSPMTHQRNQSYSRAMSAPVLSKPPELNGGVAFEANFENNAEHHHFNPSSPIQEIATLPGAGGSTTSLPSPPHTPQTPHAAQLSGAQEIWGDSQPGASPTRSRHSSEGAWANFSAASSSPHDHDVPSDDSSEPISRRKSHGTDSLPESIPDSTSSMEDEIDDSVWRINDEQRDYYTNQFNNIKPADADFIKGPQARDFFLKSNLPTEVLSKIWHLSDLDKDFALNLDEFCIAMHLVVAVRHGVELPAVLPSSLLPKDEADPFDTIGTSQEELFVENNDEKSDLTDEENVTFSRKKGTSQDVDVKDQWSADFDAVDGGKRREEENSSVEFPSNDTIQTMAQPSSITTIPMEARIQPVSQPQQQPVSLPQQPASPSPMITTKSLSASTSSIDNLQQDTVDGNVAMKHTPTSPKVRHNSTPSAKDASGTAIARPRASANKNVNLMDAPPWLLLPPPSSKAKLTLSSNASLSSAGSVENTETLVSIDKSTEELGVRPLDDSDGENERLRVTSKPVYRSNISREKSRSIDSLRSDISESSEFSWRRLSRRDSRPRSYTGSSINEPVGVLPPQVEKTKDLPQDIPPTPPPRNKGHARASSLDLNQLFAAKTSQSVPDLMMQTIQKIDDTRTPPQKPPRVSAPKKEVTSESTNAIIQSPQEPPKRFQRSKENTHRRSFSLESDALIGPPRKPTDGLVARTEAAQITRKKDENEVSSPSIREHHHNVRFAEPEIINAPQSPIEKKMRKNELQARLRLLQSQNTTLSTLISQLDIEWKEINEERLSLDVQLEKLRQT